MNGKGLGVLNIATGISLLPETRDSRPLFVAAISFLICGLLIFATTFILGRKSRKNVAKNI